VTQMDIPPVIRNCLTALIGGLRGLVHVPPYKKEVAEVLSTAEDRRAALIKASQACLDQGKPFKSFRGLAGKTFQEPAARRAEPLLLVARILKCKRSKLRIFI